MPVTMTVTVAMSMTMESMRPAAEAAICRGATLNEASIRAERSIWHASGTAIDTRHQTHRYRADRSGTHHGQDDAAGTFHAITCTHTFDESRPALSAKAFGIRGSALRQTCVPHTSRSQPFHSIVRDAARLVSSSAAAGKMRGERMRKRAKSTARHAA
jgi:hypothetical protein